MRNDGTNEERNDVRYNERYDKSDGVLRGLSWSFVLVCFCFVFCFYLMLDKLFREK